MEEFKTFDSTEMKRRIRGSIILTPILVAGIYFTAFVAHTYEYTGRIRMARLLDIFKIAPPWFWAALMAAFLIFDIIRCSVVYKQRKQEEAQKENKLDEK